MSTVNEEKKLTDLWKPEQFTARLMEKLKKLPPPFNNVYISKFLQHHQAVLTGSFLFSCVMPDIPFVPRDIDVVFGKNYHDAVEELEKTGWSYVPTDRLTSRDGYCNMAHVTDQFHMEHRAHPNIKLNVITYKSCENQKNIQKCIDEYFDLDGCTLSYNGSDWHVAQDVDLNKFLTQQVLVYRESVLKDRIKKPKNPSNATCNKTPWDEAIYNWIMDRLKKYESRGFTIANADDVHKYLKNMLEKSKESGNRAYSTVYVEVDRVELVCDKLVKRGCKIIMPVINNIDGGDLACIKFQDPSL
jgi:uncharacterized glyoxalase superfamily protein PhnB